MEVVKFFNWDYKVPLSLHLLVNNSCNLNCPKCFYKTEDHPRKIKYYDIEQDLAMWRKSGVCSLAIGGGEPMLHPDIVRITREAKWLGYYVAVTTNGTMQKRVCADRVHISFDEIHMTDYEKIRQSLRFFKSFVSKVGVNHIVTNLKSLKRALQLPADTFTLLMEKPESSFNDWEKAFAQVPKHKLWIDACLAVKLGIRKTCKQGITSMSLNAKYEASKCSNIKEKVPYHISLEETFEKVKHQKCPLNFLNKPV